MDITSLLSQAQDACSNAGYTHATALIHLIQERVEEEHHKAYSQRDSLIYEMQQTMGSHYITDRLRKYDTIEKVEEEIQNTYRSLQDFIQKTSIGLTLKDAIDLASSYRNNINTLSSKQMDSDISQDTLRYKAMDLIEEEGETLITSPLLVSARVTTTTMCEIARTTASLEFLQNALLKLRASQATGLGELEKKLKEDLLLIKDAYTTSLSSLEKRLSPYGEGATRKMYQVQGQRVQRATAEARDVAALLASLSSNSS